MLKDPVNQDVGLGTSLTKICISLGNLVIIWFAMVHRSPSFKPDFLGSKGLRERDRIYAL